MHLSSLDDMKNFVSTHLYNKLNDELLIVDLGSQNIGGSYRQFFAKENWTYIGVDIVEGENVDLVLKDPYQWNEFKSDSVDIVVSGQAFEHIKFFWLTALEIARVLKPGGLCCIIAPSGGDEHRYPVDCWRFYPDGFRALAEYCGLEVISATTYFEPRGYSDDSDKWANSVLIAQKPVIQNTRQESDDRPEEKTEEHIYENYDFHLGEETPLCKTAHIIQPESIVLELGPATGYFTSFLNQKLGCTVDCIEISKKMADMSQKHCRTMVHGNIDQLLLDETFPKESYDYIIAADVLEHLFDPEKALKSCWNLLKSSGKLIVSVPNVSHVSVVGNLLLGKFEYTDEGILDKTHLKFFTRQSIAKTLHECSFTIDFIDEIFKLPEDTEAGMDFCGLENSRQPMLMSIPDGLTYQFLIVASPSPMNEPVPYEPKIYEPQFIRARRQDRSRRQTEKISALETALKKAAIALKEMEEYSKKIESEFKKAQQYVWDRERDVAELQKKCAEMEQKISQTYDRKLKNFISKTAQKLKGI